MSGQGSGGNVLAAICSLFIAGLGQLVQGRVMKALMFAVVVYVSYALWFTFVLPIIGGIFHLWAIYDAATYKGSD
jgi:TM2 domain-containing membrane protein YozV